MIDLVSIGDPQLLQASATGAGPGSNAITVDLPLGPTRAGQYWIADSASLIYTTPNDVQFGVLAVGIFVIPVGTAQVIDRIGILDVAHRGVNIVGTRDVSTFVVAFPARYLAYRTTRDHTIIPYGWTLRGVYAYDPTLAAPTGRLLLSAMLRRVDCNQ